MITSIVLQQETTPQLTWIGIETTDHICLAKSLSNCFYNICLQRCIFFASIHLHPLVATVMDVLFLLRTVEICDLFSDGIAQLNLLVVFALQMMQSLLRKFSEYWACRCCSILITELGRAVIECRFKFEFVRAAVIIVDWRPTILDDYIFIFNLLVEWVTLNHHLLNWGRFTIHICIFLLRIVLRKGWLGRRANLKLSGKLGLHLSRLCLDYWLDGGLRLVLDREELMF